jgi:flagellar motor switch protein FliG
MSQALALTRPQKAAAILVAMGKPSASRLLKFFKQEELKALIEGARLLRTIPQGELEKIVAEFEAEFTEGAGLLDSADKMDTILHESLSPEEVDALMGKGLSSTKQDGPPPIWIEIEKIEPVRIADFLAGEHPQTSAMVLSKLSSNAAAHVLLTLEKSLRSQIVKRMMSLTAMPDAASRVLENQLRNRVLGASSIKDMSAAHARVANVLNEMEKGQIDELMKDLEEAGASDLHGIRARLFSFEDIELLSQKARAALFDTLSTDLITLALRAAPPSLVESILSSISPRARRMVEAELAAGSEGIAMADITQARKSIASTAIRMSRDGVLELPTAQKAA